MSGRRVKSTQGDLFVLRKIDGDVSFALHKHKFVAGPRNKSGYGKDGKWHTGGEEIEHSHSGGGEPHCHPNTGPSFYGYRAPTMTAREKGEQFEILPADDTFELVITDSALIGGKVRIGNTPLEQIGMPAAERMILGSRLRCIVRDERKSIKKGADLAEGANA